ncbi:MAG TPA: winged helix-turn-helix domain-containing protein [Chloroflexota bacterium]|nr:winged helix-turn-helix domain-containing protein [Chloroflexota bacterium]
MAGVRAFDVSASEARRIALAAQGFADRPPGGAVDARLIRRVLGRVGLLQIDSVNVLVRTQYLPLFARLGPYPASILETMAYKRRELFEYWGHEASFLPMALYPLLRWRMERYANGEAGWSGMRQFAQENAELIERVYQAVAENGLTAVGGLDEPGTRSGPWWGWSEGKRALEWLYSTGRLAVAHRHNFERHYDLPERVYPPEILAVPAPPAEEAQRELIRISAKAHGIGTASDLADYFRIKPTEARLRVAELVEAGELQPVHVEGWKAEGYLDPGAALPRQVKARALLSPFDPVVWERARAERLFGFYLRIEIYTPAPKRVFGYYVLPFLIGESLVGRVDLKADRKNRALLVHGAFAEAGQDPGFVAAELAPELERMAGWLGLERVIVGKRGEVAAPLRDHHFAVDALNAEPPPEDG